MDGERLRLLRVSRGERAGELARRIVLELSERGSVTLKAAGPGICILFESVRIASEMLGAQPQISFQQIQPSFKPDSRETVIVVQLSLPTDKEP